MNEEWTNARFSESEALTWRNAGFTLKQALVFREAKITAEQAIALREQQVSLDPQPNEVLQRAEGMLNEVLQKGEGILIKIRHKVAGIIEAHPILIGVTSGIMPYIILMFVIGITGGFSNPVDVTGDWSGQASFMGGSGSINSMEIDVENPDDGSISGLVGDEETPITGNVDGNKIDIRWKQGNPPHAMVELTGTVAGNEITGNITFTPPDPSSNPISGSIQLQRDQSSGGQ